MRKSRKDIEKKKNEVFIFIVEKIKQENHCPSVTEIAEGVSVANSTVSEYIKRLMADGYIKKHKPNAYKGIIITEAGNEYYKILKKEDGI